VTTNLNQQSADNPAFGAYAQPTPGLTLSAVTTYGDSDATVHVATEAAAPGALATVATCTPGAGLWKVWGTVSVSGTTVAADDSNNMRLVYGATPTTLLGAIPIGVNGTTGFPGAAPFGPVQVQLAATEVVKVIAIAAATASSLYAAQIICQKIG
jgi:hypothetical protein